MVVSLENINKSFGGKSILENINLTIEDNSKIGLIGVNGAGKTTLLNIICDSEWVDSGNVFKNSSKTIGFLKQSSGLTGSNTIIDEMRLCFLDLLNMEKKMKTLRAELEKSEVLNDPEAYNRITKDYAKISTFFESQDGYNLNVKINKILNGMGFLEKDNNTVIGTLSGGEKTRLALAKLLLQQPDLLILDEPTNHLDFATTIWLEDYLQSYKGAILVVSHDRYFLDVVVNQIVEIENQQVKVYSGNYSKFVVLKEEFIVRRTKEHEMQQVEIAKMEDYIAKNKSRASTAKSARGRQTALDKMEIIEKPKVYNKKAKLRFEYDVAPVKDVLDVKDLDLVVGDEKLLLASNINLHVFSGEKIGIIGDNGTGKSTFLKAILNLSKQDKGQITWGKNTKVGYFEQEHLVLNPNNSCLEELHSRNPKLNEQQIRTALGSVIIIGEDVYKKVGVISGGERAKLLMAILMLQRPNVLVLDEPTNHLDLATKEVLEKALFEFEGTLIIVSHDRYLLNKIPTKIAAMKKDGLDLVNGKYKDYVEAQKENVNHTETTLKKVSTSTYKSKDQRRQEAEKRQRVKTLETTLSDFDEKIAILEKDMAKEAIYSDFKLMEEKCRELEQLKTQQSEIFEEWATLVDEE